MDRINADIKIGLTDNQVNERKKQGLVNNSILVPTKRYKKIVILNIFTLFNIINLFLGIIIIYTKTYKNLTFLGVAFFNTIISIVQEIRAKYTIDKLTILSKEKVCTIRNSKEIFIDMNEIVLDDIIKYKMGNQVVVDSLIIDGIVEVDESVLTGESNYILKKKGDKLLSGSIIVSGNCITRVDCVGEDSYANKITKEAKYLKKTNSEIMFTLKKIIKVISILIIPLGTILYLNQIKITSNTNQVLVSTVAAIIGTIPEGLVLLVSTVLAVSSIRLSKKKVLVQELYCIENLARVDTICLDKTGTLTTGKMKVVKTISLSNKYNIDSIMNNISYYMNDGNATSECINKYFKHNKDKELINKISFSSLKKYSAYEFDDGTYIVGAPDFIDYEGSIDNLDELSVNYRVLFVGYTNNNISDNNILGPFKQIGLVLIEDEIRGSAKKTLDYIRNQDVDIKIISGDNIKTISNIATKLGLSDLKVFDMSTIKEDDDLSKIVEEYNIFGRVTPEGKKKVILTLKSLNHKVAMTGDGVNDVLSLKEADCSIAMASGTDAARNVSQIVLLNSDFKDVPSIIKEGRRTINNLERSSTLFLTKTIYAILLAILFTFVKLDYPFIPIQLTLISVITIGIPSFILALEPNKDRVKGHFIINVLSKSLPTALTIFLNIIGIITLAYLFKFNDNYVSTMSVLLVAFTGFLLLFRICYPFNYLRGILFGSLIGIFLGGAVGLHRLFEFVLLTPLQFIFVIILCIIDVFIFNLLLFICNKMIYKNEKKILK